MNIKPIILSILVVGALIFSSCDAHDSHDPAIDTSMHIGDVVCTDGSIVRYENFNAETKKAAAVVFFVNNGDATHEGTGYAVCLNDIDSVAFSDSLGVKQGTSCSLTEDDGNTNTYSLLNSSTVSSPIAIKTFQYMHDGQCAYVPSVAQMQLLYASRLTINSYILSLGGTMLPTDDTESWYWTSTEVEGQEQMKAWLFSLYSGLRLETSKLQEHKVRPMITVWK